MTWVDDLRRDGIVVLPGMPANIREAISDYKGLDMAETLVDQKTILSGDEGKGWHVDPHRHQVKAMLVETDIGPDSPALEYLMGSHLKNHRIRSYEDSRFSDETVAKMDYPVFKGEVTAGTVIVFDTNGIHRRRAGIVERRTRTTYFQPL